jgi:hypothetical protein
MERITVQELKQLEQECLNRIKSDHLYKIRNDAKLRAVNSSKSYDEFKYEIRFVFPKINLILFSWKFRDIVDAAHLKPLSAADKKNAQTKRSKWNGGA